MCAWTAHINSVVICKSLDTGATGPLQFWQVLKEAWRGLKGAWRGLEAWRGLQAFRPSASPLPPRTPSRPNWRVPSKGCSEPAPSWKYWLLETVLVHIHLKMLTRCNLFQGGIQASAESGAPSNNSCEWRDWVMVHHRAEGQTLEFLDFFFPSNAFMASARSFNTFNCMLQIMLQGLISAYTWPSADWEASKVNWYRTWVQSSRPSRSHHQNKKAKHQPKTNPPTQNKTQQPKTKPQNQGVTGASSWANSCKRW